jgi:hypothetical protein
VSKRYVVNPVISAFRKGLKAHCYQPYLDSSLGAKSETIQAISAYRCGSMMSETAWTEFKGLKRQQLHTDALAPKKELQQYPSLIITHKLYQLLKQLL